MVNWVVKVKVKAWDLFIAGEFKWRHLRSFSSELCILRQQLEESELKIPQFKGLLGKQLEGSSCCRRN